jgi:hypothetical protein
MDLQRLITPANVVAGILALIPFLAAAFFPERLTGWVGRLPVWIRYSSPALLSLPYVLVTCAAGNFCWEWFSLYGALPVAVAILLGQAPRIDASQRGNWRDFLILAVLGLAVDLRWFEAAWPARLAIFNKVLLLDAGIYGFVLVRNLNGTGFDLRLRMRDVGIGLREVVFYTPIALALGLSLGFLHLHLVWPGPGSIAGAWVFTFFFIAVPEELFFRGWLQNLLERRMGRYPALLLTSVLFGLAHFNKRAVHFNWRYVLLAAVAGFFYGRAWRRDRRVGASAVTHASVDAIWSLWLK